MCKTNPEAIHKLLEAQQVKMGSNFIEKMKWAIVKEMMVD
jgi:hypothetical protein